MALKTVLASLDGLPDALKSEYRPTADGKGFQLQTEGDIPGLAEAHTRLAELRQTNIDLLKGLGAESIDAAKARLAALSGLDWTRLQELKDIDPAEYRRIKAQVSDLEGKGVRNAADIDQRVRAAIDAALAPVQKTLAEERQARSDAQARADAGLLRQTIGERFVASGGYPEALDVILSKAPFRVVDGKVVAADTAYSARNPGALITVEEYIERATKDYHFAFKPSSGGGANNSAGLAGARPGSREVDSAPGAVLDASQYKFVEGKGVVDGSGSPVVFRSAGQQI
jgi:hypothetical protein